MRFALLAVCLSVVACGGPERPAPIAVDEAPPVSAPVDPPPDAAAPAQPDAAAPLATPSSARVTVAFSLQPRVGEHAPTLHVTIRNPNPNPVPLTRFDNAACFARHYLAIELTRPGGSPAVVAPCAMREWPGTDDPIAPNGEAIIELPFADLFTGLGLGIYGLELAWDPSELERARPGTGVAASSTSLDATQFAIARVLASFRIARGKTVALPGGHRLTFRAHGHKHTMAGGPPSPLIIHGALAAKQGAPSEFSINVFTDETRLFSIDEHTFELVAHDYDGWMQLRYFGRLALD